MSTRVTAVASPEDTVAEVDIAICATNTVRPVFKGEWLRSGMHLTSIMGGDRFDQRREVDDETIRRADVVVATSKDQAMYDQQGDLYWPIIRAVFTTGTRSETCWI